MINRKNMNAHDLEKDHTRQFNTISAIFDQLWKQISSKFFSRTVFVVNNLLIEYFYAKQFSRMPSKVEIFSNFGFYILINKSKSSLYLFDHLLFIENLWRPEVSFLYQESLESLKQKKYGQLNNKFLFLILKKEAKIFWNI